jgi:cytochrome c-type biogenesis protein CcmE
MKPKHRRALFITCAMGVIAIALGLILTAFNDNLIYFYTPTMLDEKKSSAEFIPSRPFRLGGLVVSGSLHKTGENNITFNVTDGTSTYTVQYKGLLPTLFREGQGVVLTGTLSADNSIAASNILAKHDEYYMPPEVAAALKKSGHWGGEHSNYPTHTTPAKP